MRFYIFHQGGRSSSQSKFDTDNSNFDNWRIIEAQILSGTTMTNRIEETEVDTAQSEIAQFFSGRKVLVTGGLGFLGKLLIEKLLRSCPNIAILYVFVRRKNGKSPQERIQQLAEMPLYERLKKEQPDFLQKLIVIESNLNTTNLGLSPQDRTTLLDTNVIFHGTTIIRSNQKLRTMANIHVQSTKQILLLAKEMPDLKAFVHLSSVFAYSVIKSIEEKHYPPPLETDKLLSLLNNLNDDKLETIAPALIGTWPNVFAFTKAIAEDTVLRYRGGIPACIVRSSVVTPTWKEPIAGWTDSVYGPVGLLAGSSLGLLRTIHCHTDKKLDFVPADYVTSSLIAAAWHTNVRNVKKDFKVDVDTGIVPNVERVPVYNCVSSCQSPITWQTFRKHVRNHASKIPGAKDIRLQCIFWTSRLWIHKILMFLFHLLPAIMVDAAAIVTGRDARWCKIYDLIHAHLSATSYFTTQQWHFTNNAMVKLWGRMNAVDREIFEFDMSNFDWVEYVKRMTRGIRAFIDKTPWDAVKEGLTEYIEL
ncbi:Fatty acyl-CoA reductase 1 [Camponotus floridanus]|uniref:Fatty acyl-CoA reductase n=1 Tax=Camponotus floridanus TaxID=104421 RepID=E2A6S6_CAMFO|nr:Fatty acyl-CoA reductase 1 [Camponotus floridanus]